MKKSKGEYLNFFTTPETEEKLESYHVDPRREPPFENVMNQQRQRQIITEEMALPVPKKAVVDFVSFADTGFDFSRGEFLRSKPRTPQAFLKSYPLSHHNSPYGPSLHERTSMTDKGYYQLGSPYDHERTQTFSRAYPGSVSQFPFQMGCHGLFEQEDEENGVDESSRQTFHLNNKERMHYITHAFSPPEKNVKKTKPQAPFLSNLAPNPFEFQRPTQEKQNFKDRLSVVNDTINDMVKGPGPKDWGKIRRNVRSKIESSEIEYERLAKKIKLESGEGKEIEEDNESKSLNEKSFHQGESSMTADFQEDNDEKFDEDDEKHWMKGINGRSSKGLRIVSLKVKDIVCKKKETTYKDVAEALIEELKLRTRKGDNLKISELDISKDEQNVRRRVYDALNVLISAEVLKKKGKIVFSDQRSQLLGNSLKKTIHFEKRRLLEEIQRKREGIEKQKDELKGLILKVLSIKNLFQRNYQLMNQPAPQAAEGVLDSTPKKSTASTSLNKKKRPGRGRPDEQAAWEAGRNESAEEGVISNKNKDFQVREKIKFPFLVLPLPKEDSKQDSITLNMNKTKTELRVISNSALKIYGDLDVLLKLGFYKVSRDCWMEWIPKEMHEYIPEEMK